MIFENRVGGDDKLIDEFTVIASYQVFSGYHREMKLYIVKYILFQCSVWFYEIQSHNNIKYRRSFKAGLWTDYSLDFMFNFILLLSKKFLNFFDIFKRFLIFIQLAGAMANGGEVEGKRILSPTAWVLLHTNPIVR